jgi:hypothetical protein
VNEVSVSQDKDDALRARIDAALEAQCRGQEDEECRSPLDFLVDEVVSGEDRQPWNRALLEIVKGAAKKAPEWWQALEFFVAVAELQSIDLADALEDVLTRPEQVDARGRGSIYALLAACHRPVSAKTLSRDGALREAAPLLWLDLILPLIPELEKRQSLILELVRQGQFGAMDFTVRLDHMRTIGGAHLGNWLRQFGDTLPDSERAAYAVILEEAGFTLSELAERPHAVQRSEDAPSPRVTLRKAFANYVVRLQKNSPDFPEMRKRNSRDKESAEV